MKLQLSLEYTLGGGHLRPFLEGLAKGNACAAQCTGCGRVTFPPERVCITRKKQCQAQKSKWLPLSGQGEIVFSTRSMAGAFALVQFDGADNRAVCRIGNPELTGVRATLVASGEERPAMTITPLEEPD